MELEILVPFTRESVIEQQRAKLERLFTQVQPGLSIEIIRYGKSLRSLVGETYQGGELESYCSRVRHHFDDAAKSLRDGQTLRIQLMRNGTASGN